MLMSIFKFVSARLGLAPLPMHKKTALIPGESIDSRLRGHQRWKATALASAATLALLGVSLDAQALALGAVTVRSALGEPLRAEIEVPQISSDEASSFQATLASPQAFRAAGVEYSQSLAGTRVSLHRRANGQAYLRLVGDRPVNEPFIGVVIEANWANGRIVRDYTMLVDPPGRAAPPPVAVTPSQTVAPTQTTPAPAAVVQAPATAPIARPVPQPAEAPRPTRRAAAPTAPTAPAASSADGGAQVTVQRGDTAYGIVSAHQAEGVSLDQMLIALLRANPQAFIGGNVNRMRAGAVLNMPSAEQAGAVSHAAARRAVLAQSRDFNAFRRGLAQNVRGAQVASASRSAAGGVQAQVQESRPAAPSQDRLTISRGGATTGAESAAAQSRQSKEQADRVAELNKNISDLARLQSASGTAPAASAPGVSVPTGTVPGTPAASAPVASAPATPASATMAPATVAASSAASAAMTAATAASEAASAAAAVASASDAAASAAEAAASAASAPMEMASAPTIVPAPIKTAPPPPAPEPSFLDTLTENPLLPVAGIGLLALLAGYGIYRSRQRKKDAAPLDSSFIESRLQPDSFFGASGGQRVNTRETTGTGNSSMAYSPSQLDAAGDVDPVAEADVYLAYGRDMQAEEILKEALRTHPGRVSIHRKLAEIYAKRRDVRALEAIAVEAYDVTHGDGPDWLAITALGSELDPDNQLYKPGGAPIARTAPVPVRGNFGADTEPQTAQLMDRKRSSAMPLDVNLDLDNAPVRGAGSTAAAGAAAAAAATAAKAPAGPLSAPVDLDLGLDDAPVHASGAAPLSSAPLSRPVDLDLGMDFAPPSELGPDTKSPSLATLPPPAEAPTQGASINSGMIEFDMDALSVDPDSRSGGELNTEQLPDADDDPIATKLALAQEFHAIGDTDGARSLVKEVIAEATGSLKARAERFLAELG